MDNSLFENPPVQPDPDIGVWSVRALAVIGVLVSHDKVEGEALESLAGLINLAPNELLDAATLALISLNNIQ